MRYICKICIKECKQIRVDTLLPKQERKWTCDKCYFNKKIKKPKKK